ncbi:MAG: nucleotide disphospho-sugar-binding domain-containing protein [Streptomycetales bacterium]
MRIMFTVIGSASHFYSITTAAWACRAAGHEVALAAPSQITKDVISSGLPFVAVGQAPDLATRVREAGFELTVDQQQWPVDWPVKRHSLHDWQRRLLEVFGLNQITMAEAMADDLVEFARDWRPALIVHDGATLAGPVAASVLGIPNVSYLAGSPGSPRLELRANGTQPLPQYVELFERFGAAVRVTPTLTVDPCPPSMRFGNEEPRRHVRYIAYNGHGAVPRDLDEPRDRPRVCLTWGHTSVKGLGASVAEPYRAVVDALHDKDVEILVVTTEAQRDMLGALPPGSRFLGAIPLQLVLPHCDVIVHHGGTLTALSAAVLDTPQLVITVKPETTATAGRLATTGAAAHLPYQSLPSDATRMEVIADVMNKLLEDPKYVEAAQRLGREIESLPTPADLVPEFEALRD